MTQHYAGGGALQRRMKEIEGYKNGGPVRGPGTGTSDEVPDVVPDGTYIMPTDSTKAFGAKALGELGQRDEIERPGDPDKAGEAAEHGVPVNLSNGEFKMPPEQVHAIGVQALDQMKNATHTPTPANLANPAKGFKPELFFNDGGVATDDELRRKQQAVQGATGVVRNGSTYSDAPAVQSAPAQAKPNYFPGNSPDAGSNVYGGAGPANGIGSSGQQAKVPNGMAGGAQPPAPQILQNMGSRATAVEPAASQQSASTGARGTAGLDAPWYSREYVTAANMSDKSGLQLEADRASKGASLNIAADDPLKRAAYTGTFSAPQPSAKPNYNFPSTTGAGRGLVNPPSQPPAGAQPPAANAPPSGEVAGPPQVAQRAIGGGIERIDRPGHSPLYTDNKDPQMAGFLGRPAGGPTQQVQDTMQRMSDQSKVMAFSRFEKEENAAQYAREVQQAQSINAAQRAKGMGYMRQKLEYDQQNAQRQDATTRRGQDVTAASEAGRNALDGRRITADEGRYAIDAKAKGFDIRLAERMQGMQDQLQVALEAGDEKRVGALERQIRGITGKGSEGKFGFHFAPNIRNQDGSTTEGGMWRSNTQTGQAERMDLGQSGALPAGMTKQVGTAGGKPVYEDAKGNRFIGG